MLEQRGNEGGGRQLSVRQKEIFDIARARGAVDVDDLARRFRVTPQTIRRDLNLLCDDARLRRTHGGAVLADAEVNLGYQARRHLAATEKRRIGELAASLVDDGSSLFINIGTTTEQVATHLRRKHALMVITNNINVVNTLLGADGVELVVAGGAVRHEDGGIVGERTSEFLSQFHVDCAVIGTSAISPEGTLLDYDFREVLAARAIIEHARSVILVADASKFGRSAPIRVASIGSVDHLVTDREPPEHLEALCRKANVTLHIASRDE